MNLRLSQVLFLCYSGGKKQLIGRSFTVLGRVKESTEDRFYGVPRRNLQDRTKKRGLCEVQYEYYRRR